jgi:TetR/AcrR family transcriptional repressor of nem operon
MRKSKAEAAETRERIVDTASAVFRRQGIAATGLADLMGAAGLTHGGFYKHFSSKEQLVAEASTRAIEQMSDKLESAIKKGRKGTPLQRAVDAYLSTDHLAHPEMGCPLAALGPELAREGQMVRKATGDGLADLLGVFRQHAEHSDSVVTLAALVGAMTLARVAPNASAANDIIEQVRAHLHAHLSSTEANA